MPEVGLGAGISGRLPSQQAASERRLGSCRSEPVRAPAFHTAARRSHNLLAFVSSRTDPGPFLRSSFVVVHRSNRDPDLRLPQENGASRYLTLTAVPLTSTPSCTPRRRKQRAHRQGGESHKTPECRGGSKVFRWAVSGSLSNLGNLSGRDQTRGEFVGVRDFRLRCRRIVARRGPRSDQLRRGRHRSGRCQNAEVSGGPRQAPPSPTTRAWAR